MTFEKTANKLERTAERYHCKLAMVGRRTNGTCSLELSIGGTRVTAKGDTWAKAWSTLRKEVRAKAAKLAEQKKPVALCWERIAKDI